VILGVWDVKQTWRYGVSGRFILFDIINSLVGPHASIVAACWERPERNRAREGNFGGIGAGNCSASLCHQGVAADIGLPLNQIWVGLWVRGYLQLRESYLAGLCERWL
jgi:hypothetical protein